MKTNKYSGTKTEQNLRTAFSGESEARNKYTFFASKAKKEGYTGDKRTIAFVLSLVGLIGGLVVLIITVILINVLAVPGITALRDMLGMIGEMANDI